MKLFILFIIALSLQAWGQIDIKNNSIYLIDEKLFEDKLELKSFKLGNKTEALRETGYILANTQSTYQLDRFSSKWVNLTDTSALENDLDLASIRPDKGLAYGVITTSIDLSSIIFR